MRICPVTLLQTPPPLLYTPLDILTFDVGDSLGDLEGCEDVVVEVCMRPVTCTPVCLHTALNCLVQCPMSLLPLCLQL